MTPTLLPIAGSLGQCVRPDDLKPAGARADLNDHMSGPHHMTGSEMDSAVPWPGTPQVLAGAEGHA